MGASWYRKAAEQGDALGQFNVAMAYIDGLGFNRDVTEGVKWMRLAADKMNRRRSFGPAALTRLAKKRGRAGLCGSVQVAHPRRVVRIDLAETGCDRP